jgi:hypothetical protein
MKETEFDKLVVHTLRVELLNGQVLRYNLDVESKQYLMRHLRENSDGDEDTKPLHFIWFQTSQERTVIINTDSILRLTFCFDPKDSVQNPDAYYDNFKLIEKETTLKDRETPDGEVRLHVVVDEYLPQAIIYHKGIPANDDYYTNPLKYNSLEAGALEGFELELEGDIPYRQFIELIDDDGETSFLPLKEIIVLELETSLIAPYEDDPDLEEDEFEG